MRPTLFLLFLSTGCAVVSRSAPVPPEVADMAGCYALEYGAWGPEIHNGRLDSPADLPTAIRLTTERSGWREGRRGRRLGYVLHALSGGTPGRNPFPVWTPMGRDSLRAGVPIQFGGFNLSLRREGAELRGEVEAYTDAINPPAASSTRTGVTARRIPCPSS